MRAATATLLLLVLCACGGSGMSNAAKQGQREANRAIADAKLVNLDAVKFWCANAGPRPAHLPAGSRHDVCVIGYRFPYTPLK